MNIPILFLIIILSVVDSARILMFPYYPAVSHQRFFQAVWKELSLSGHEVVVVAPNPLKDSKLTNLTEIDASDTYKVFQKWDNSNLRRDKVSVFEISEGFLLSSYDALEIEVNNPQFQEIMEKPSDYFDLLIVESHLPAVFGLQHKFKAPLIGLSSLDCMPFFHNVFGNTIHPILYPEMFAGTSLYPEMTLLDKLDTIYVNVGMWLHYKYKFLPDSDALARKLFGSDMPYIEELMRNASLNIVNINPILSLRRPNAPNVVEVFDIILKHDVTLPNDLQKVLDEAKNGVVYFSLGTNVRFEHVEGNIKQVILEALGELPYTVLCKWESEDDPKKPKNVVLKKWFPQQAILAHPNVKVFVTQGGLQSSEEAISNAVPLVVIPFLGDQPMNAQLLTRHGMAETIKPKELNKENLRDTILKIIDEERYRLRAQELRSIFLDQPQSGLDKVVWWCEYVIRHKGAKHLRSPSADISLYEYFMLDVFAVIFVMLFIVYKLICIVFRVLSKFMEKKVVKLKEN